MSQKAARVQLTMLLATASDERVAGFTVDFLASTHAVPRREIECLLLAQQDKRRRANAEAA